jgi:hypothetical protein
VTPVGFRPSCGRAGAFLGRTRPYPGAKLDLSFSTGQGSEAISGRVGQCPAEITRLPNTQICTNKPAIGGRLVGSPSYTSSSLSFPKIPKSFFAV